MFVEIWGKMKCCDYAVMFECIFLHFNYLIFFNICDVCRRSVLVFVCAVRCSATSACDFMLGLLVAFIYVFLCSRLWPYSRAATHDGSHVCSLIFLKLIIKNINILIALICFYLLRCSHRITSTAISAASCSAVFPSPRRPAFLVFIFNNYKLRHIYVLNIELWFLCPQQQKFVSWWRASCGR